MSYVQHGGIPQTGVTGVAPQGVIVIQNTQRPLIHTNFKHEIAMGLGIAQLITAVLSVVFNSTGIESENDSECWASFSVGTAIWCAAFYFISGGLAMATHKNKSQGFLSALMGMAIMSVIHGAIQFAVFVPAYVDVLQSSNCGSERNELKAYATLLYILGLVAMATSIWITVLCGDFVSEGPCCTCCCEKKQSVGVIQYANSQHPAHGALPQHMMMTPQTNQVVVNPVIQGGGPPQYTQHTVAYPMAGGTAQYPLGYAGGTGAAHNQEVQMVHPPAYTAQIKQGQQLR